MEYLMLEKKVLLTETYLYKAKIVHTNFLKIVRDIIGVMIQFKLIFIFTKICSNCFIISYGYSSDKDSFSVTKTIHDKV